MVPVWRKRNTWSQQHVCLHRNKLVVQWGLHDPSNLLAGDVSEQRRMEQTLIR